MRYFRLLLVIGLFGLGAGCESPPHSQSARRYVEFPACDLTTSKYYLLDRSEVQRELGLTKSQIAALAKAFNSPFTDIPGLGEMIKQYKALSDVEKRQQKSEYLEKRQAGDLQWLESRLGEILNGQQQDQLDALLLQMKGPKAVVLIPGLNGKLGLTPDQTVEIKNIISQYGDELTPFVQRFGHNMLQYSRRSQTIEESVKEQDAIVVIIKEILKARDEAILSELTKAQCDQWHVMQGRLLPVSWPEGFYVPFHNYKKASKSPEPTAVGAVSSAVAVHVASRRWLSFLRRL